LVFGVLPYDSYPPPPGRMHKFLHWLVYFFRTDPNKGAYVPREFLERTLKKVIPINSGRLLGYRFSEPPIPIMISKPVATALEGRFVAHPSPRDLRTELRKFLADQLRAMAGQVEVAMTDQLEALVGPHVAMPADVTSAPEPPFVPMESSGEIPVMVDE